MVLQIYSATEFRRVVIDGSREQLVVVDFYADWCGPCRMVAPFIDSLATKFHQVLFVKVNVDEVQDVAQLCRVHAMPTFQLFLNGNKVDEIVGADVAALERSVAAQAQPVAFAGPGHTLGTRATSEDTKAATTTNSTPSGTPIARPLKRESKVLEIVRREAIGAGGSHLRARTPVGGIVQWPAGIGVVVGE
jgi:thioredoxin